MIWEQKRKRGSDMEHNELDRQELGRWMKYLYFGYGAGLILGLMSLVPLLGGICALLSELVTLAVVYILYQLGTWEAGYRRGALYMALALALQLINYCFNVLMLGQVVYAPELAVQLGLISGAMVVGSTVCSMIGMYHVYRTHGIMAPAFAAKWHGLFLCTVGCAVTVSVVTAVAAAMSLTWLAAAATLVFSLASFAFEILRLVWLREMVRQFG
jgi:hypothetical protein